MSQKIECPYCGKYFSKFGIKNHIAIVHEKSRPAPTQNKKAWNKGLTKETDERVKKGSLNSSKALKAKKRKHLSEEHKKSVSEGMKKAHEEGRAWNIGKSRWNNEQSYPEQFFQIVIQNEFQDQDFKMEFPLSIWSYDFAWEHKKKAIEIDGDQHQRFEEYQARDKRKDEFAVSEG